MVWWKTKAAALGTRLGIQPGEGVLVTRLGGAFAIYVFTLLLGRTVRDSLFLNAGLSRALPAMYVGTAITVILSAAIARRLTAGHDPMRQTRRIARVFAVTFLLIFGLLAAGVASAPVLLSLYFWVEIVGALLMVQFWAIANDSFDPRQAKRLYSLITAGQVFGNLACGAVAGLLTPYTGTQGLLIILAGTLLVSNVLLPRAEPAQAARPGARTTTQAARSSHDTPETRRFIRTLIVLSVLTFITTSLVDFQFKLDARNRFSHDELTRFFGMFYGGVGACAFFVQIFFSQRLVRSIGLFGTLAVMPAGFIFFGAARSVIHNFWVGTALKFDEHLLRYSLNDPLSQLLVIPLPNHRKRDVQQLLGGTIKPAAIGLAGLVLVLLSSTVAAETLISAVAILAALLAGLWLAILYRARRQYVDMLADATQRFRRLSVPDLGYLHDPGAAAELSRLIARERAPHTLSIALAAAEHSRHPVAGQALSQVTLDAGMQERLRARSLTLLDRTAPREGRQTATTLLTDAAISTAPGLQTVAQFVAYRHGGELPARWDQLIHGAREPWVVEQVLQAIARRDAQLGTVPAAVLSSLIDAALDRLHDPLLTDESFFQLAQLVPGEDLVREALALLSQSPDSPFTAVTHAFCVRVWRVRLATYPTQPLSEAEQQWLSLCLQARAPLLRAMAQWAALEAGETRYWQDSLPLWPRVRNPDVVQSILRTVEPEPYRPAYLELLSRPLVQISRSPREMWPQLVGVDPAPWLDDLALWLRAARPQQPLLARSLLYAVQLRIVWVLRWAAVYADSHTMMQLAQHAIVARGSSRATLIEVLDQELEHGAKARLIALLEDLNTTAGPTSPHATAWSHLPWSTDEQMTHTTGHHILHPTEVEAVETVERIVNLAAVDLFRELPIQSLARIAAISENQPYPTGARIIQEGAEGDSLYLLVEGEVEVQKGGKTLVKLARGACFGEMSLLDDQPRSADVVAASACRCLRISRDDFEVLLMDEPAISRAIMSVLTARLRAANTK